MPTLENKICKECQFEEGHSFACSQFKEVKWEKLESMEEPTKKCAHKTLDPMFPSCEHCLDCPWTECADNEEPPEEELNELIRDLTKVGSISKSEVKRRISQLLAKHKEEIKEKLKHIAMIDHGKEPKYFVKDVLKILD